MIGLRPAASATTIACTDKSLWDLLTYCIGGRFFRPYMTDDIIGAQIGGAVKNIIAIACGIAMGKTWRKCPCGYCNRGFAEITRLNQAKGGRYETLMGLSGLGDLILTCSSPKSRNTSFGIALGEGKSKEEILERRGRTANEGVTSAESISRLAKKLGVAMPICDAVHRVLYENVSVDRIIEVSAGTSLYARGIVIVCLRLIHSHLPPIPALITKRRLDVCANQ